MKKKALRQDEILAILAVSGYRSIEELSEHFHVTTQTIRRDIADLAAKRTVKPYHGGAALAGPIDSQTYSLRRQSRVEAKRRIAEKIAEMTPEGASVFLDAGSTCEAVAHALTRRPGLRIVTYSLRAALILADQTDFTVAVPGGYVRNHDGSLRSDKVTEFLARFRFDLAIFSVSGIRENGDLEDDDLSEVATVRAAFARSQAVVLAADSSKFGRSANVRLGSLTEVTALVTDAEPSFRFPAQNLGSRFTLHKV
ncbi:DeoR/GlpR family DNA-binding transcription regulator [Fulvimarina endophytica]|uniref:DeoR/GlpR family DNA-binding transcription regulator n=1 Tax=Fulvimarina endophytica TaxID=2293836 RepID=UPI001314B7FE|nr:DeoR/GlpR family DNA-binding transcription regulator [Fulvimarina endophytica]